MEEMEKIIWVAKKAALMFGFHEPVLLAQGSTGKRHVFLKELPGESKAKLAYLFKLGAAMRDEASVGQLEKVFLVFEGWMVRLSESESRSGDLPRPSQDKRRVEVLLISQYDVASKHLETRILDYVRDERGLLIDIKEDAVKQSGQAESPLPAAFVAGYNFME